jgi:hypothetical protein
MPSGWACGQAGSTWSAARLPSTCSATRALQCAAGGALAPRRNAADLGVRWPGRALGLEGRVAGSLRAAVGAAGRWHLGPQELEVLLRSAGGSTVQVQVERLDVAYTDADAWFVHRDRGLPGSRWGVALAARSDLRHRHDVTRPRRRVAPAGHVLDTAMAARSGCHPCWSAPWVAVADEQLAASGCQASGCRARAGGSRPARSQPTAAAVRGRPTTVTVRWRRGTRLRVPRSLW